MKYAIEWSARGVIDVEADSKDEAEEIFFDLSDTEIMDSVEETEAHKVTELAE